MKAIILAAGKGSRMGSFTKSRPKSLVEIKGVPIIKKQVESLKANNVDNIVVITGYKEEQVRKKVSGVKFYSNKNYSTTGMLETLHCAKTEFDGSCLLVYGDLFMEPEAVRRMLDKNSDFCLAVDLEKELDLEGDNVYEEYYGEKIQKGSTKVKIENNRVVEIGKKIENPSGEYAYMAKIKDSRKFMNRIQKLIDDGEIKKYPSPSYILNLLIQEGQEIDFVELTSDLYKEIDFPNEILEINTKAVLFDAEGVIYYRDAETLKPIVDFFKKNDYDFTGEQIKKAYEKHKIETYKGNITKEKLMELTLEELNVKKELLEEFNEVFIKTYSEIKIMEGIEEVFSELNKKGIKIVILTDTFSSEKKKWEWFNKHGLGKYIDSIFCSSETGFTKDKKESYLNAMGDLTNKEVFFVGHSDYEMLGAEEAGIKAVSFDKEVIGDVNIEDIRQLLELI